MAKNGNGNGKKRETALMKLAEQSPALKTMDPAPTEQLPFALGQEDAAGLLMTSFSSFIELTGRHPRRLPERIGGVSGNSTMFEVIGSSGAAEGVKELVGVIIAQHTARNFWTVGYEEGEKTPPDCESLDGINGVGLHADACEGQCARCPMAARGSAKPREGQDKTFASACTERKYLYLVRADNWLPSLISLPPTSLSAWNDYAGAMAMKMISPQFILTKITLQTQTTPGGDTGVFQFENVGKLPEKLWPGMREFGTMILESVGKAQPMPVASTVAE